jgi:gas vesicle protein
MDQQDSGCCAERIILSFFVGCLIGAGVAILTAPKRGEETRKMIEEFVEEAKEKAEDCIDQVKGVATAYFEKGKDFIEKESNIITKTMEAGIKAYEKEKQS